MASIIRKLHNAILDHSRDSLVDLYNEFLRICENNSSVAKREFELRKFFVDTNEYDVSFCVRPHGRVGYVAYMPSDCSVRFFYSSGAGRFSYSRCVELTYKAKFISDFIKSYENS